MQRLFSRKTLNFRVVDGLAPGLVQIHLALVYVKRNDIVLLKKQNGE